MVHHVGANVNSFAPPFYEKAELTLNVAPPLSQKVTQTSATRLETPSQRLWFATNFLQFCAFGTVISTPFGISNLKITGDIKNGHTKGAF